MTGFSHYKTALGFLSLGCFTLAFDILLNWIYYSRTIFLSFACIFVGIALLIRNWYLDHDRAGDYGTEKAEVIPEPADQDQIRSIKFGGKVTFLVVVLLLLLLFWHMVPDYPWWTNFRIYGDLALASFVFFNLIGLFLIYKSR